MENYTFDLQRIFFGHLPLLFLFEIALRTAIMLFYTLFLIRMMGKRGLSHLSLFEFVLIIALGSAVGDPMFYPDIPVIHGMVVITVVVGIQEMLIWITNRSRKIETALEGRPETLIVEGRFVLETLKTSARSRNEIYMGLRMAKIEQLGEVKRSYLEINGEMSVFRFDEPDVRPGLSVMPEDTYDKPILKGEKVPSMGEYACMYCGHVVNLENEQTFPACPECHQWARASRFHVKHG